jgi:beta-lactamase class A
MKNKQKNITKLLITKLIECKSYLIGGIIIGLIISNVFAFWKKDLIVNIQPLRDVFQKMGDENPNLSIYFEFLNTGANIAVNKDMAIWPASLMKIPIAMAVMKKIEEGSWQMDSELVLYEEDKDDRFGDLYQKPAGSRFTVEELLLQLLDRSDNTARTILMRNLEKGEIEAVLNHLGIEDIFDKENKVTGKKYSIFWRALYTASYLSQEHSQQLIEIMTKSETNEYLSLGIPKNVLFSHKIGVIYENNIYADSGIVYVAERPYVITVMIQDQNQEEAEKIMQEISQKAYNYVENY